MHHTLEGLRRKYEAVRGDWAKESLGRTRLQKRRPIEQNRQESTAREAEPHWRIGDDTTAIATELAQDSVRVIRRQLTAECIVSVVYPTFEKPGASSVMDAIVPVRDASEEHCTTQDTPLASSEANAQATYSANDEADNMIDIPTEDLPPLTHQPAIPHSRRPHPHRNHTHSHAKNLSKLIPDLPIRISRAATDIFTTGPDHTPAASSTTSDFLKPIILA